MGLPESAAAPAAPPDQQIAAIYLGTATPDEVHAAAGTAAARSGRTCQANFHVGAHHVERGELADARALLQSAIGKCRYGLIESGASRLELKRLERLSAAKQ